MHYLETAPGEGGKYRTMMINSLRWAIDVVLRVDRSRVLNWEAGVESAQTGIGVELRTIVDQLNMEAFGMGNGLVDYQGLRDSPTYSRYRRVAGGLTAFDPAALQRREERLAFWINLYDSLIIYAVISFGIDERTVWERGWGFFCKAAYDIGGLSYSANDVEHRILRNNRRHPVIRLPQFVIGDTRLEQAIVPMDPRIHFTLVCASRSCPLITVYHVSGIEEELAANSFVNGEGVMVKPEEKMVSLSWIFKWYQADFGRDSGAMRFILRYLINGPEIGFLRENIGSVRIVYQKYEWSLNHY